MFNADGLWRNAEPALGINCRSHFMKLDNFVCLESITMDSRGIRVSVCQLGARLHYGAARSFERRSALELLITDICAVKGWPRLLRAIPPSIRPASLKRLLGRDPHDIPPKRISMYPQLGLEYQWLLSRCRSEADRLRVFIQIGKRFGDLIVKRGFGDATHVYTFSSAALEVLEAARAAGLHTVLEQPIAAKEVELQIMEEEHKRYPDWEPHSAHYEETKALAERERSEWEIADTIIVPSKFVADSLEQVGISAGRCVIVPYGVSDKFSQIEHHNHEGPLRVLSVGGMQLRKGSQYTCEAAKILGNNFVFRFVGECLVSDLARRDFGASVRIVGHVPRSEVSAHFEWADVFLLPSLCEGMATVLIEALAAGLPVITTANSGLEVRDGVDGFVVPIRNSNAIAERLGQLASDPCLLAQMSQNARERSAEFTLDAYGDRLYSALASKTPALGHRDSELSVQHAD